MRRSADFTATVRSGRRARRGDLVVHHRRAVAESAAGDFARPPLVGLIVGRGVGGSVVRHRVSRRLRGVMARRLGVLPPGSATVVRALPSAAEADSARLAADVDAALDRLGMSR